MLPLATPTANTAFSGLISVVAPLYNEAATVAQLVSRVAAVMRTKERKRVDEEVNQA